MARKGGLTVITIQNLAPKDSRYEVGDPACPGLYLQVHPSGAKSWAFRFRFGGKSRKLTIGGAYTDKGIEVIKIGNARDIADEARVSVARRIDPIEANRARQKSAAQEAAAAENTLRTVAGRYLDQHKHLRTIDDRTKVFERLIYPVLGSRQIETIKRSEIADLLDDVATSRGVVMADRVLSMLRGFLNWHAVRSDDYVSPIVSRMARTSTKARARNRVLSEIELQALWRACDEAGIFGHYIRFTLLTATRRNEAANMSRTEITGEDWVIPGERYKTKLDHLVPLSAAAVAVLGKVPKIGKCDFVFTPDGVRPLAGFGCRKQAFDNLMLAQLRKITEEGVGIERWTLHDLRRSARTLMSQAGVTSDIAELCLGHLKQGVEATYDRFKYRNEKRGAFEKLADLVGRIVGDERASH
jgi:integrase